MTTHQELRDELAGYLGWSKPTSADPFWSQLAERTTVMHKDDHPIPLSLDWLSANGLPPLVRWTMIEHFAEKNGEWAWHAMAMTDAGDHFHGYSTTELESRLRCCVAAWKEHLKK